MGKQKKKKKKTERCEALGVVILDLNTGESD